MKPKRVLMFVLIAVCCGDAFSQEASGRLLGSRRRMVSNVPARPGPARPGTSAYPAVDAVENELKDIWSEPTEDFKVLSERAMRDDPQALFALSQICKERGMSYDKWSKYLKRSAELGYVKAQLRIAIDSLHRYSDVDELQNAKISCTNAIAAGYLCVTNLIPFIDDVIQKWETSYQAGKRKKEEQELMEQELRMAEVRQNGVTRQFKPFVEEEKIAFDEALSRAETNDVVACYWIAYYFAKGESVNRDGESALKFLEKAVDANHPAACYTFGLLLENDALQDENGRSVGDRDTNGGFWNMNFSLKPFGAAAWYTPTKRSGSKCLTNNVAVAHVESLYQKAVDGGLPYATNDIARLQRKVAECKRRIAQKEIEEKERIAKEDKARSLISDPQELKAEEQSRSQQEELDRQREFWSTWPTKLSDDEVAVLNSDWESKYNCVYLCQYGNGVVQHWEGTNTWEIGSGKSLVVEDEWSFRKIDSMGRIVAWGENSSGLEELRWYKEEYEKRLEPVRKKWAEEKGLTLEEATLKYKQWQVKYKTGRISLRRPGRMMRRGL